MNYQEFRCEFLERMKEVMEEGVSITTEKINKNNGVVMEGLVLKSENARVASIFYMEDYFLTCSVLHAFIIDGGYFFSNVLSLKTQRFVPDFLTGFDRFFFLERRSFKIIWRTLIYIVI